MSTSPKYNDSFSPAVDVYIAKSAAFAQPILTRVRELVHKAVPEVVEEMKWSRPFFIYKGIIVGNVSAFKAHCSVGLWGQEMAARLKGDGLLASGAMGSLGRVTSVKDLPTDKQLVDYFKQAKKAIDEGVRTKSIERPTKAERVAKAEIETPAELTAALKKNKAAAKTFAGFSPSCKREYVEWIADAKRDETRAKRVADAVTWMAEGKRRNWKYENC
jgi:uncharacterized protein YdeI (YjbR/CyaY-like superfamily)